MGSVTHVCCSRSHCARGSSTGQQRRDTAAGGRGPPADSRACCRVCRFSRALGHATCHASRTRTPLRGPSPGDTSSLADWLSERSSLLHEALQASPTLMPVEPTHGAGAGAGAQTLILPVPALSVQTTSRGQFPTWSQPKGPDLRLPPGQQAQEGRTLSVSLLCLTRHPGHRDHILIQLPAIPTPKC